MSWNVAEVFLRFEKPRDGQRREGQTSSSLFESAPTVLSEIRSPFVPRGPFFVLTNEKISTVLGLIKIHLPDCGNLSNDQSYNVI